MAIPTPGLRAEGAVFDPAAFRVSAYRNWLLGGLAGAVALILLGWFLLIRPELTEASQLREQTATTEDSLIGLRKRLAEVRAENDNLAEYRTAYTAARKALPTSAGVSTFLRDTQAAANRTGTTLKGLTVGSPSMLADGTLYGLPITVTATGSLGSLDNFLHELQRVQPRTVLINEVSLTSAGDTPVLASEVSLTIGLKAFVAPSSSTEPTAN